MNARELSTVLDRAWQSRGRELRFTTADLAADWAAPILDRNVSAEEVGRALQAYRVAKRRKYDVACQGYGVGALWRMLGVHNHASTRRRDLTEQHRTYTVEDALRRRGRDLAFEVLPALVRNGDGRSECKAEALKYRSECYATFANEGLGGDAVALRAEEAFEPVRAWYVDTFGEAV